MNSPADNYWPEPCAACNGTGKYLLNVVALSAQKSEFVPERRADRTADCIVCGGKAFVLVLQPAQRCRQRSGTGRLLSMRCAHCRGTGWMFTQKEQAGFLR
jgi:DnaJ-class molecular chaperone